METIRSKTGMLIGMLDERARRLQIKDGQKLWLIPVPNEGMTVTTVRGGNMPEQTHITIRDTDTA